MEQNQFGNMLVSVVLFLQFLIFTKDVNYCTICDCLSENPLSSHLLVFREIPF